MKGEPLVWKEAARKYWYHLAPIIAFPSFALVLLSTGEGNWRELLVFSLFFLTGFSAMWPVICGKAKYSFWILACVCYVFGGGFLALIAGIFVGLIRAK